MNVTQLAQFKNPTTVTRKQAPVMQFQGVKPSMEETTVDPVTLPLTAPFHNANVSVHQKKQDLKVFQSYRMRNR